MGSGCEILIREKDPQPAKNAVNAAVSEIERIEKKYSFYQSDSFLSAINREAFHGPVLLDKETAELLHLAASVHQATHKKFDPTIGTIKHFWNFDSMQLPEIDKIEPWLVAVGWHNLTLSNQTLRFHHPETRIDMGGIVKEYAVDRCASLLEAMGIKDGLVNLGGDLKVVGKNEEGKRPWRVGIADPRKHNQTAATILLKQGAVVTSGDYQRYFIRDGKRYHHILNPLTGFPMELAYSSVTVHGQTALGASQTATLILLGEEKNLPVDFNSGLFICNLQGECVRKEEGEYFTIMDSVLTQR